MFCSQCGKKVTDTMLFCPFCGSPIVVPDQDDDSARSAAAQPPEKDEPFVPLNLETQWDMEDVETIPEPERGGAEEPSEPAPSGPLNSTIRIQAPTPALEPEDVIRTEGDTQAEASETPTVREQLPAVEDTPTIRVQAQAKAETGTAATIRIQGAPHHETHVQDELVRLEGRVPTLGNTQTSQHTIAGRSDTHVPVKAFNPNDMFMDGGDRTAYDDYDDDDYTFEEPEEGSFFIRHIRGIVALGLFLIVGIIVVFWLFSGGGQLALARANLAWRADVYEDLAFEAYEDGSYTLAGDYYARALTRDGGQYKYANSAGIAYYQAGDVARAEEMAKKAIEIDPSRTDAYHLLLRLYPATESRPWEITSLLQSGYQLTGEDAFKME